VAAARCGVHRQLRAQHFSHRLALVAGSAGEAQEKLRRFARGQIPAGGFRAEAGHSPPPVAFLFSGQGAQYAGMARELDRSQSTFRRALDQCDELLRPWLERPCGNCSTAKRPTTRTWPGRPTRSRSVRRRIRPGRTVAAVGVEPLALLGHSIGEYVAACLAGVFDLPSALNW